MKILALIRVLCIATLLICAPVLLAQAVQPPGPAVPVVVQPPPSPGEPIGANVTTALGGGALLAIWEVIRRVVLPLVFPSNPLAPPSPPQPPQPPVVPPFGPQGNPWFDLLRLVIERLLAQPLPVPMPLGPPLQAVMTDMRPAWLDELVTEIRAGRKSAA